MKKKKKIKDVYVCERCGNPVSPYAVKCKWCKKTLRPEYYEDKDKNNTSDNNKDGEE